MSARLSPVSLCTEKNKEDDQMSVQIESADLTLRMYLITASLELMRDVSQFARQMHSSSGTWLARRGWVRRNSRTFIW